MADTKTFGSKQFHYNAASLTFTAEASCLGLPPGEWPQGFYLRSARTGAAVWCGSPRAVREQDTGERGGTDLIAVDYTARLPGPARRSCTVRILND